MGMHQLLPPPDATVGPNPIVVNGRTYYTPVGVAIVVPDFDGVIMQSNGWSIVAKGGTGTTAQRPVNPPRGTQFFDSTLATIVQWDGKVWRNHATGAAA